MYFHIISLLTHLWMATSVDPLIEDLKTPILGLEACGYDSCKFPREGKLNVHIVPHSHPEYGMYRTFQEYYDGKSKYLESAINMKRILDFTITEMWAKNDRTFTLSDTAYLFQWWADRDGTVRRMVYELLRNGRLFFVGGGWAMVDESSTTYHGIIDQFTHALRKLNGTFGPCGRPLVAWQADVYGHSREFTSLAAQLGFDGLFINPISFDDEVLRVQSQQLEMLWRGSDDLGSQTDIFTHKLFDGYWSPPGFCFGRDCNDSLLNTGDSLLGNVDERVNQFIETIQLRQSPSYTTSHVMVMMGMRMAYYDASVWYENIDFLIRKVNQKNVNMHLAYSTPACYLKAVYDSNPLLPIKQDDFMSVAYDYRTHLTGHYTSRSSLKKIARELHIYLQMANQMQVLAKLGNNNKLFEDINWAMGVIQDHQIISGAVIDVVKDYYMEKMYHALLKSALILKQAFNKLRKSPHYTIYYRCNFNESSCPNLNYVRSFVVIYNPLGWPVSMPVRIPIKRTTSTFTVYDPKLHKVKSVMMKIPEAVLKIPSRDKLADNEIVFIAESLPPMGFRSYYIESNILMEPKKKRSIIKKLKKKTKYFARQTDQLNIDDKSLLDEYDNEMYRDDETTVASEVVSEDFNEFNKPSMRAEDNMDPNVLTDEDPKDTLTTTTAISTTKPTTTSTTKSSETDDTDTSEYYYRVSKDTFIGNKYITLKLDDKYQVASVNLSNGVQVGLNIMLCFYAADDPAKFKRQELEPNSIIFKPMDPDTPELIMDKKYFKSTVTKSFIVEEIHTRFTNWASYTLRVYQDQPVVEVDWVIGPVPVHDGIGKDIFIRYSTSLENDDFFYTDSNGRQTIKRMKNDRPLYQPVYPTAVAGNYYPVNSKIYIQDLKKNIRMSIFNDRAQGGTSLKSGQIDLMVHRRLLTNEKALYHNEMINGTGIVVRGKHYLYLSKADYKPNKIFEKKFAKEIALGPQVLAGPYKAYGEGSKEIWYKHQNEYSGMTGKIPVGVHILTLQEWNAGAMLLRLENYLEKADIPKSGYKTVFIKNLFSNITINSVRETTLGGNVWIEDWRPLQWNTKEKFIKNFNEFYRGNQSVVYSDDKVEVYEEVDINKGVKLKPQQIRTFIVSYDYN